MANAFDQFGTQEAANPFDQFDEKESGIIDSIGEFFTGSDRATPQTEALPELQESGLLSGESLGLTAAITPALLTATDPNEIADIITSNFPNVGVTYNKDAQGGVYPVLRNNETGAVAQINRPGISGIDVMQGLGIASAFTPAGRAGVALSGVGKAAAIAGASGATSAAIEGVQELSGGEFDIENVIIDTIAAGALEAVPALLRAHKARAGKAVEVAGEEAISAEAARISQDLSPEALAAKQQQIGSGLVTAAEAAGKSRAPALKELSEEVLPDPKVLKSAEALGVEDALLPSQYSQNQAYIEIEQGLASIPGSKLSAQQKETAKLVAQKADDLITEFGGVIDKSELSGKVRGQMIKAIDDLDFESGKLYDVINDTVPKRQIVNMDNVISSINNQAKDLGGAEHLDSFEKKILSLARGRSTAGITSAGIRGTTTRGGATYSLIDKERKKIGSALRKGQGVYKDESSASLKKMYGLLTEAQEEVAKEHGMGEVWNSAKALVQQRKALEEESINVLGKDLAGAIMPKVGAAIKKLTTGDYKDFDKIVRSLPKESRQEVVLSALNDAFTMGSRAEKQLSAPGFVDWMEGLGRNKEAKKRIYRELPRAARVRLENLFIVARGMRNASKERITTGRITALLDNFSDSGGMVSKLYQTGKKVAAAEGASSSIGLPGAGTTGVIVDALSKRAKDPISKAADDLLSSPEFQRAAKLTASSNVKTRSAKLAADKALAKSERAKMWVSLLPSDAKREIARVGILSYLEGEE